MIAVLVCPDCGSEDVHGAACPDCGSTRTMTQRLLPGDLRRLRTVERVGRLEAARRALAELERGLTKRQAISR